ncbi:helix-turn-helix domain-containing protein [Paenibacillus sp. YN15]|uniref:helix-turn-helix domain-containing protein n=1 Tax=Paenibacillus sp. YN15 TaxID=1742774 RepID=UPI000DCDC89C|nr:helix-turn-helix transcriptional regulator [Paenibacillus sp. YN15]RAU91044.1 transcriptional regulator [Paenibacillus sp. YN15]
MGEIAVRVGEVIRDLRKQRGLSQEKLALKAGINTSYMGQIERAEKSPTLDTLEKIAVALDVELEQFFQFDLLDHSAADMTFMEKIQFELKHRTPNEQEAVYQFVKQLLWFRDSRH